MNTRKNTGARGIGPALLILLLASLGSTGIYAQAKTKLVFGVAPGPYEDILKLAIKPGLEKKGYSVDIKQFSDYVQPDVALGNGSIDANLYQHILYLEKFAADNNLKISPVISIPTAGLGIYSRKVKSIDELKKGDVITIANDATNLARALRFLQSLGLLTIKADIDATKASEKDIDQNPKGLVIKPLEAAQLPRTLDSVTASVVNGNYAIASGIPLSSALNLEVLQENIKIQLAVRTEDLGKAWVADVKAVIESPEFEKVIDDPKNGFVGFAKPDWLVERQKKAKK